MLIYIAVFLATLAWLGFGAVGAEVATRELDLPKHTLKHKIGIGLLILLGLAGSLAVALIILIKNIFKEG